MTENNDDRSNDRTVVIFTDVDGTLLNERYEVDISREVLDQTFDSCSVVMVSSRTLAELLHLQESLGLYGECIAENGGVIASYTPVPSVHADDWDWEIGGPGLLAVQRLAAPIGETMELVKRAAAATDTSLELHSDLSAEELARRSGYTVKDAERSLDRQVSVLLDPSMARAPNAAQFFERLAADGCSVSFGGRWISVVRGSDKGKAVLAYLDGLRARGENAAYSVGIGNESNDTSLLKVVDRAFVINNPNSGHVQALVDVPNATLLTRVGCAGWQEMADVALELADGQSDRAVQVRDPMGPFTNGTAGDLPSNDSASRNMLRSPRSRVDLANRHAHHNTLPGSLHDK